MSQTRTATQWTPGPWHRNIKPAHRYPIIFAGRNTHVARVEATCVSEETMEGNCNLIVQAPAMAEAIELVLADKNIGYLELATVSKLASVLLAAKGEAQS